MGYIHDDEDARPFIDDFFDDDDLESFQKSVDDHFFESTPCAKCGLRGSMGFMYCQACGLENEDFRSDVDAPLGYDCEPGHEMQKRRISRISNTTHKEIMLEIRNHCGHCGEKLL